MRCLWGSCKSEGRQQKGNGLDKKVKFIPFPKPKNNLAKCKHWIQLCGLKNLSEEMIKNTSSVCSLHFVGGQGPTQAYPHPFAAPSTSAQVEKLTSLTVEDRKRARKPFTLSPALTKIPRKKRKLLENFDNTADEMGIKVEPVDINEGVIEMELGSISLLDQIDPLGMEVKKDEERELEKLPETNASFEIEIKDEPLQELDTEVESLVIQPVVFICKVCIQFFTSKTALNEHESNNHAWSKLPFCCQHCKFGTKKKVVLQKHILFKHIVAKCKKIKCKICSKIMVNSFVRKKKKHTVQNKKDKYAVSNINSVVNINVSVDENTSSAKNISSQVIHNLCIVNGNGNIVEQTIKSQEIQANSSDVDSCNNVWEDSHDIADNASDSEENSNNNQEKTRHTQTNELACKICNREFRNQDILKNHIKNMHRSKFCLPINENSKVSCDICHIYVNTKHTLEKHIKNHHLNQKLVSQMSSMSQPKSQNHCHICNKNFVSKYKLKQHIVTIHKKQVKTNKTNNLSSKSKLNDIKMNLKSNKNKNIDIEKLKCKFCKKWFKGKLTLENHIKIHDTDFPTCKYCSIVFLNEDILSKHLEYKHKIHLDSNTESKNTLCNNIENLDENAIVKNKHGLCKYTEIKAMENSNGVIKKSIFWCKICNIKYSLKRTLKQHMKKIHSEIKYFDYIVKGVPYRESLATVKVSVSNKNKGCFTCDFCSITTCYKGTIMRHIKNKHLSDKHNKKTRKVKQLKEKVRKKVQNLDGNTEITLENVKAVIENGIAICKICDKNFSSKFALKKHMIHIHPNIQYYDYIAEGKIYRESYGNFKNVDKKDNFTCNTCNVVFKNKILLKNHENFVHIKNKKNDSKQVNSSFQCNICNLYCYNLSKLKVHKKYMHFMDKNIKNVTCELCGSKFRTIFGLQQHEKKVHFLKNKKSTYFYQYMIHEINKKLTCKFCFFKLASRESFKNHIHEIHLKPNNIGVNEEITPELEAKIIKNTKKKLYICDICDGEFYKISNVKKHIKNVHIANGWTRGKHFFCEICNKSVSLARTLRIHKKVMHPKGKQKFYNCDKCNFKSIHKKGVRGHDLKVHLRSSLYICKICKKRFLKRKLLHSHMDFEHSNSRIIYTCGVCNKKFDDKSNLKLHILRSHSTEKTFLCHLCPKSFAIQSHLTAHIKNHNAKFCCEVCGKILKSKQALRLHLEGHAKICKVFCDFCQKGFRRKEGMVKHYLAFHSGVKKTRKRRTAKKKNK